MGLFRDDPINHPVNLLTVTKDDSAADPLGPFSELYVGGAGDVKVTSMNLQTQVFTAVPAGSILTGCFRNVWSTGTGGSTNLVGRN